MVTPLTLTEDCVIPSNQASPGLLDAGQQLPDHFSLMVSACLADEELISSFGLFLLTSALGPKGIATVSPCRPMKNGHLVPYNLVGLVDASPVGFQS